MHKVLIVDDDRDLLEMVEMSLTAQGFNVSTLAEGKLFFTQVQNFEPDIILLDVYLHDADGRQLCYQLKSDPVYRHIPVALYSAGHMSNSSIADSGANIFITKPFNIKQLGEKLKGMLTMQSSGNILGTCLNIILLNVPLYIHSFKSAGLVKM